MCNDETVDIDLFIYNQLLRHVGTFGVKIPIALLRVFSCLLIHLNVVVLTTLDVLDIEHDMQPSRDPRIFDTEDLDEGAEGFFVHQNLASRIVNTLTAESRALSTSINLFSERRVEVDLFIRHLKTLTPSTSTGKHGLE